MSQPISCPQCGGGGCVEKVSTIYLVGIGLNTQAVEINSSGRPVKYNLVELTEAERRNLARRLKPPASRRRIQSRPLHPDLIVITFSLLIPLFVLEIYNTQIKSFLPVLGMLGLVYGFYFWKRKAIIAGYQSRQSAQQANDELVRQGIERWMKLYYCAQDDIVFTPDSSDSLPADRISEFWRS